MVPGHCEGSWRSDETSTAETFLVKQWNLVYLLSAILLTNHGSNTVHIYTQTIHGTTKLTTLVGRLSGIRTQSGQTKINEEITA